MSKVQVKVGDKIVITAMDYITKGMFPEIHGKVVKVSYVDASGEPYFDFNKPTPRDSIYSRRDAKLMQVSSADGWKYEVVKDGH